MNRIEENQEILKILTKMVETYPQLRFGQILCNFNVLKLFGETLNVAESPFYEESKITLERIKRTDIYGKLFND